MISLYHFLYDFFMDVPSFGTAVLRSIKIYLIAILMLALCMLMDISAEYAAIVVPIPMFLPAILVSQYFRQRSRAN